MLPVKQKRPVNLDLGTMKFPPMAIVSILHRISGVLMALLLPFLLYLMDLSLTNETLFTKARLLIANPYWKLLLWAFVAALIYHLLAGTRHLIMDLGYGETLSCGRRSAVVVIVLAAILTILMGIWIW